jgi:hypothetical protein
MVMAVADLGSEGGARAMLSAAEQRIRPGALFFDSHALVPLPNPALPHPYGVHGDTVWLTEPSATTTGWKRDGAT